jgi:hypothetical protein
MATRSRNTRAPHRSSRSPRIVTGSVAFLDALATRGVWNHASPTQAVARWDDYLNTLRYWANSPIGNEDRRSRTRVDFGVSSFSDTMLITAVSKSPDENLVVDLAQLLQYPFIDAVQSGILLRGVISYGMFVQSEASVVGPAVDEAAAWYELPEWLGISLTPSAKYAVAQISPEPEGLSDILVPWEVPLSPEKSGGRSSYNTLALNWPGPAEAFTAGERAAQGPPGGPNQPRERYRRTLLRALSANPTLAAHVSKHENTLEFFDEWYRRPKQSKRTDPDSG